MNYRFLIGNCGYQGAQLIGANDSGYKYSDNEGTKKIFKVNAPSPRNLNARQYASYSTLKDELKMIRQQMQKNNAEGKPNDALKKGEKENSELVELYEKIASNKNNPEVLKTLEDDLNRLKDTLKNRSNNGMLSPRLRKHIPELDNLFATSKTQSEGGVITPDLEKPVITPTEKKPVSLPQIATGITGLTFLLKMLG